MTRCYEKYWLVECKPDKCTFTSERQAQAMKQYMRFMKGYGVKFDNTPEDIDLFQKLRAEHGTEGAFLEKPQEPAPIPRGDYSIILADPPWRYEDATPNRAVENKYPTMELETIKKIEVPSAANAILYLWATAPKLEESLEVMNAWGFKYRTHAIWDKVIMGMGYWFRGIHELLLVGVKGTIKPPDQRDRQPSIFREKRTTHSTKPPIVYEMIEGWFPDAKKIELFARSPRQGWTVWGDEI